MSRKGSLAPLLIVAMLVLAAGCSERTSADVLFAPENCRRVAIIDETSGRPIVGAEDLAFNPSSREVLISAYNRRAVEKAVREKDAALPEGGVYAAPIAMLTAGDAAISVRSLVDKSAVQGGLRPHGFYFDTKKGHVSFVNRAYASAGDQWRLTPRLVEVDGRTGSVLREEAVHCAANDVAAYGRSTILTFDHSDCGLGGAIDDAFALRRSGFLSTDRSLAFAKAGHANGLAMVNETEIALAATRERSILLIDPMADKKEVRRVRVPGAPDNLTLAEDGRLIAAVHPSMLAIGLSRKLGIGRSGSRIVSFAPDTNTISVLFDDPKGAVISAATVGLLVDDTLIIGSVIDDALAVCRREDLMR